MSSYWSAPRHWLGIVFLLLLVAGGVWLAKSYTGHQPTSSALRITATFYPLAEVATSIAGSTATVTTVTPPGEEPHAYHPTAQQLVAMQNADLLIYNGATFEPWIDEFMADYDGQAVAASQGIELLPTNGAAHLTDPHFWLDPVLMEQVVATIRDAVIKANPADTDQYSQRADHYLDQLRHLDQQFSRSLAGCQTRRVISSHEALRYLAKRYQFDEASIAGISPEEEPTPARLAQLSQTMEQMGISTVLYEATVPQQLAATLAEEVGATTAVFDPIEGLSADDMASGADYFSIQKHNLDTLAEAMSCQ